jgi:hypothetical protein
MSKAQELSDIFTIPGVAWGIILLQVAFHYYQSVCKPLWLLLKQTKAGLHGCGECLFSLQRQFRFFFQGSGQSDKNDNLE